MTWSPPARPAWVESANRGDVWPVADEAAAPLELEPLLAEARARLGLPDGGLDDFGTSDFLEPLGLWLDAIAAEAELNVVGRWMTRQFLVRLLCGRLHLLAEVQRDPGVVDERVAEPIVVTGAPRTGTTVMHALLAQDPRHRAPLGWELLWPAPPPGPATADDDARIALADRELRLLAVVSSDLDAIHEYTGRMTKECLSAMSFAFRSEEFVSRYHVPTFAAWLFSCDMGPAYDMHRLVLQVLQRRWPSRRWTLKSPVHLHSLPTLLEHYPDARIVVTHRDPLTVLGSVTSLIATLRWAHSDRVDYEEIAREHARLYHSDLDGLVTACSDGTLDPSRVHHVRYADFMSAPIDAVRGVYHRFGWELSGEAEGRMRDYLAHRPQGMHGPHVYSFADLGLDRAEQRARFARYQKTFDVPDEA